MARVTLSAAGIDLFDRFGWTKPAEGRLVPGDRIMPGCVRVDWEGTQEYRQIHRKFVVIHEDGKE